MRHKLRENPRPGCFNKAFPKLFSDEPERTPTPPKTSIGRQAEATFIDKPIDNPRASSQAEGQQPKHAECIKAGRIKRVSSEHAQ
jgi:hypothetical protein